MMLQVRYRDRTYDMVKPFFLGELIRTGRVGSFRRSDGWVDVDSGPLRKGPSPRYLGTERRSTANRKLW